MHQLEEPFDTLNGIYAITRSQKGYYTVDVEINGHKVNMQLDTVQQFQSSLNIIQHHP